MNLPYWIDQKLDRYFKNDVFEVDDDDTTIIRSTESSFYCCNCTRHLNIKYKANIIGRQQHRCIDCHKIISEKGN